MPHITLIGRSQKALIRGKRRMQAEKCYAPVRDSVGIFFGSVRGDISLETQIFFRKKNELLRDGILDEIIFLRDNTNSIYSDSRLILANFV